MSQSKADRVNSTPYSEPAEHGVSCGASVDTNEAYGRAKRHEASRATGNNSALERKTVHSGVAYDINGGGGSAESSERARRLKEELGWEPSLQFEEGLEKTVRWYLDNPEWSDRITSGEYRDYYRRMYGDRD